ncbi:MAG: hypothetical protein AAGH64_10960, partial [Planctomycetota bacterium]
GLRAALLIVLAVLIAGPRLAEVDERVERDWVLVLVDRSASMSIPDVAHTSGRITREAQLTEALRDAWPAFQEIASERTVVWLGFDAGAFDLEADESLRLGEASGSATALGAALDQALARAAARPLSSVVLLTDGRSVDTPTRAALRRLRAERVPVHSVALGSPDPVGDIAIRSVDAPRAAFAGDVTPVRVELDALGAPADEPVTLRLVDNATGLVLDEREVLPDEIDGPVTLTHKATEAGEASWSVEAQTTTTDLVEDNNSVNIALELVDRPLRVLYIDGYPRWEQRYLRNLLLREASILSSGLMLAADRRYTQEGDIELTTLPGSPEDWEEFDIVIIGDVRPDVLRIEQLEQLRDHIAKRGAGLLWIGGEASTPSRWFDTELADLLPFSRTGADGTRLLDPFVVTPALGADRLGVLRLSEDPEEPWPAVLDDPGTGWSTFYYGQAIDPAGVKPTAEVLAFARSIVTGDETPIALTMRYGAGRSVYIATDEVWRYRYGRAEVLYERFWVPLVRMLGRESLSRAGRALVFRATPTRAIVERPVRLRLELLDQALIDAAPREIRVALEREAAAGDTTDETQRVEVTMRRDADDERVYLASWQPPTAGVWTARPNDPLLADAGATEDLAERIEVALPQDELRRPETDHGALRALASETGGVVVEPSEAGTLTDLFPNRQLRVRTERAEPLWDTPLALIVVLLLVTGEWVGRRLLRFV